MLMSMEHFFQLQLPCHKICCCLFVIQLQLLGLWPPFCHLGIFHLLTPAVFLHLVMPVVLLHLVTPVVLLHLVTPEAFLHPVTPVAILHLVTPAVLLHLLTPVVILFLVTPAVLLYLVTTVVILSPKKIFLRRAGDEVSATVFENLLNAL